MGVKYENKNNVFEAIKRTQNKSFRILNLELLVQRTKN